MLIYEVQIDLKPEIATAYREWLPGHVERVLNCAGCGFQGARILQSKEGQLCIQYEVASEAQLEYYFEHYAPVLRAEGEALFAGQFTAHRRVLRELERRASGLLDKHDESTEGKSQLFKSSHKGESLMNTTINWAKIKAELNKLTDVEHLKTEINKVAQEIRKMDIHLNLSPAAQKKLTELEKRYTGAVQAVTKAQRQFDREFAKIVRVLKSQKMTAQQKMSMVKKVALEQKSKIQKVTKSLNKTKKSKSRRKTKKT